MLTILLLAQAAPTPAVGPPSRPAVRAAIARATVTIVRADPPPARRRFGTGEPSVPDHQRATGGAVTLVEYY